MTDPANGLSVLHVIVRAGPTNSQYNEHCLPVLATRTVSVCSLLPADVQPPDEMALFEGDGTYRGCFRALRRALAVGDYDVVHVHAPASGIVALLTYLRLRRPRHDLVFTVHNSWQNFRRRNRLFLRLVLMFFPLVVVCGQAAHDSMPARLRRRRRHVLQVIPNGVDLDRIDHALEDVDREPSGGLRVVSVNRLIPIKDPATTVEAFMKIRHGDDDLVLLGDGPLRDEIAQRVNDEGLALRVHLDGVVPRDDVYRTLGRSDVFVSTSGGEGLPVALLEAMACRVPVVVSDIAPHREVARAAHGLPLIPVGDVDGFARALDRVRAQSAAERERTTRRLRRCVEEQFSVRSMNQSYGALYRARVPRGAEVSRNGHPARPTEVEVGTPQKLRQRIGFLVAMTLLGAAVGFGVSFIQTPVFQGVTSLQVGRDLGTAASKDALDTSAALAVRYADLARREPVLAPVAAQGYAEDWRELQRDVFTRAGDMNPQLVEIEVFSGDRERSKALATAVAASLTKVAAADIAPSDRFVGEQLTAIEDDIQSATQQLEKAQAALPAAANPDRAERLQTRIDGLQASLVELRASYSDLETLDTSESGHLSVVDAAWTSRSPLRPAPLALVALGAAIGLTLAIGWVHLSGQQPSPPSPPPVPSAPDGGDDALRGNGHPRTAAWAPAPVVHGRGD
jgi:glycosyltransferase involved in cell wall biosynthesis/capsular polysaccharide biosynthesis protein